MCDDYTLRELFGQCKQDRTRSTPSLVFQLKSQLLQSESEGVVPYQGHVSNYYNYQTPLRKKAPTLVCVLRTRANILVVSKPGHCSSFEQSIQTTVTYQCCSSVCVVVSGADHLASILVALLLASSILLLFSTAFSLILSSCRF